MTQPRSMPARVAASTAPLFSLAGSSSPACKNYTDVVRVSWNDEGRSPAKKDLEDYLVKYLLLHPTSTKVEMRLSRRSAFVLCGSEEGARN